MASVKIETGTPYIQLYFVPYGSGDRFVGFVNVVHKSVEGKTTTSLKVYRGRDKDGNTEYFVDLVAGVRKPLKYADGSPIRDEKGQPKFETRSYGSISKELKYKIGRWLTLALNIWFMQNPQATPPATSSETEPEHVVARDEDETQTMNHAGF